MAADAARAPAPSRTRERRTPRKRGPGAVGAFLLFGAAPVAALVWFLVQPQARRAEILARVPEGAGGRAIQAGICVVVLVGLARVALPAFHGTAATLRAGLQALRTRPPLLRALLLPFEALLWLLWFLVQALFAVDAVLIVATAAATLLLVARILKPDLLSDVLPELLR
jgi:hypothetical protein